MKSMVLVSFTPNLWAWYQDNLREECRSKSDLYTEAKKIWIIHQLFINKGQMIYIIQMKNIHGLMEILDYNAIHYKM